MKYIILLFCIIAVTQSPHAQPLQNQGPQVEILIENDLVLKENDTRQGIRDDNGNLITQPDDIILYTLTAGNRGNEPAHNVEIVDPIPEGTQYILDSASGNDMQISYSIDGGHFFQQPPVLFDFRRDNGTIEKRPAPARLYTHVKWLVTKPIQPGQSVAAAFKVQVISKNPPQEGN